MPKRVVIHVGLPKCGSSSVQLRLAGARAELAARGFLYPLTDRDTGEPILTPRDPERDLPQHIRLVEALMTPDGHAALDRLLRAFDRSDAHTLVLSSESWVRRTHRFPDGALAALRAYDVELVLFVRRRDQWLLAMYKQAVRAERRRYRGRFDRWLDDPPGYDRNTAPLRLADMTRRLEALTGGRARVFDLDRPGADAVEGMGDVLGVPLAGLPDWHVVHRAATVLRAQADRGLRFNASLDDAGTLFLAMSGEALDTRRLREVNVAMVERGFGEAQPPPLSILTPGRSAELVAGGAADRERLGLAPVPEPFDPRGAAPRQTLTAAEWRTMADALAAHLTADARDALALAGRGVAELP